MAFPSAKLHRSDSRFAPFRAAGCLSSVSCFAIAAWDVLERGVGGRDMLRSYSTRIFRFTFPRTYLRNLNSTKQQYQLLRFSFTSQLSSSHHSTSKQTNDDQKDYIFTLCLASVYVYNAILSHLPIYPSSVYRTPIIYICRSQNQLGSHTHPNQTPYLLSLSIIPTLTIFRPKKTYNHHVNIINAGFNATGKKK